MGVIIAGPARAVRHLLAVAFLVGVASTAGMPPLNDCASLGLVVLL
ncbi:hypothetical protein [Actinomadura oligospora]|nr:hypothetical protein [Actinomadura oligospora]